MARTVRKNISLDENDSKIIVNYCKNQGYTFSGFLIRCAKQEIRSSPTTNIPSGLWEKLFK